MSVSYHSSNFSIMETGIWNIKFRYTKYVELVGHAGTLYSQMDCKRFSKQAQTCTQNKSLDDSSLMSQL